MLIWTLILKVWVVACIIIQLQLSRVVVFLHPNLWWRFARRYIFIRLGLICGLVCVGVWLLGCRGGIVGWWLLFGFKVPIVTPVFYCNLVNDSGTHSKSSVLAVSFRFIWKIMKNFHNFSFYLCFSFKFRFNIRGLLSTNPESDRRLFYWEGGDVNSIYPPSPVCISKDFPG